MLQQPRVRLALWFAAYLAAGLAVALLVHEPGPASWYPPVAIGIGLLLRNGVRWWPLLLAGQFVISFLQYEAGPGVALAIAGPTALEAVVGWWLIRRIDLHLDSEGDALRLVGVAAAVATVGAAIGTPLALLAGRDAAAGLGTFTAWWLGDITALVTVLPLVLLIAGRERGTLAVVRHRFAAVEIPVILAVGVGSVLLSIAVVSGTAAAVGPMRFLWGVPVLWAAVRYERLMASLTVVVMAVIAMIAFTRPGLWVSELETAILQLGLVLLSMLGLTVSATLAGRRGVNASLRRALDALAESERRYAQVFAEGPAIQFLVDPDTLAFIEVSEAAARFYGYPRDQLRGMRIGDLNPDPEAVTRRNMAQALEGSMDLVVTHRLADGRTRQMTVHAGPVEIEGRRVLHAILRDATDELAARVEVARLAAAVESSAEAIITTDLEGRVTGWNAAAELLFGYACDDAMDRRVEELLGSLDIPESELAAMALERRSIRFGHVARRTAGGDTIPVDLTISPIIAEGAVIGMSRISHDLRHILEEEERLRRSEALLADAAAIGGMGSWEVDPRTGEAAWSDELYRITGIAPGEPVGAVTLAGLAHPEDAERVATALGGPGGGVPLAFRLTARDGRVRSVVASWRTVVAGGGVPGRTVGVLRDVTDERAMEEQLRQAQRLESIGMLAGGVAHDFNNLLTAISGFADLARTTVVAGGSPDEDLAQVEAAVDRGRGLTSQLLTFGRRAVVRPRPVDVGRAITALVPMLRRLLGEDITIVTDLEPDVVAVMDPGQLDQVLVNLAVNARDAMPDGGQLRLATGRVADGARAAAGLPGDGHAPVWLEVEDDGQGIPPELLDRIFEPFFTTKERGRGTGLGLATVQGIVGQAGGTVDVGSEVGRGTVFRVVLPGVAAIAEVARTPLPQAVTGEELVLLVEDEELVRRVGQRVLERAGFRVVAASNVPDALELVGRQRPDAVVSDIVLPGLGDGISLAEELHARWPELPILLVTGYTERVPPAWASLLTKPYEVAELVGEVRRLLDEAATRATVVPVGPGG